MTAKNYTEQFHRVIDELAELGIPHGIAYELVRRVTQEAFDDGYDTAKQIYDTTAGPA